MQIRAAQPGEYAAIGSLIVDSYVAEGIVADEQDPYVDVLRDTADRAAHSDVLVAIDEHDGRVYGAVTFVLAGSPYAEIAQAGEGEFRMLAVDPADQGRGIGTALVHECIRRARSAGCTALVLCTVSHTAAAQRMYARLGFERAPARDWQPVPGPPLIAYELRF